ncbi:MAG TPA: hypothetical protein VGE12_09325 [Noviherbaspirillum sp.]
MHTESAPAGAARVVGVLAVVVLMALTIWRSFGGPPSLFAAMIAATAVLVAVEFRNIPSNLRTTSLILLTLSVLLLPFARSPLVAIQRGVFISCLLIALMASVMLLARCALRSRVVHVIGSNLRAQRPGRRYGSFTFAGQLFSGMLGMAGANIVMVMAAPPGEPHGERKTSAIVAIMRGFSAASFWSPMFGNMAILLTLYPTLRWSEVFPVGVAVAQLTLIVGILIHRSEMQRGGAHVEEAPPSGMAAAAIPLLGAMLAFLAIVLTASRLLGISTTAAIVLLGPWVAVALNIGMSHRGRRLKEGLRRLREDMLRFPGLASEAILFIAAGCAGSVMGDAFPASWVAAIGASLGNHPAFGVAFLMFGIMGVALCGIHPVLTAVFLASTITPEVLGLPPLLHVSAILTGWGLSASLTPFSVLSLTASRYAGDSLYRISMARNAVFALVNSSLACVVLTAVALVLD